VSKEENKRRKGKKEKNSKKSTLFPLGVFFFPQATRGKEKGRLKQNKEKKGLRQPYNKP
jgi:hypothetical protein